MYWSIAGIRGGNLRSLTTSTIAQPLSRQSVNQGGAFMLEFSTTEVLSTILNAVILVAALVLMVLAIRWAVKAIRKKSRG